MALRLQSEQQERQTRYGLAFNLILLREPTARGIRAAEPIRQRDDRLSSRTSTQSQWNTRLVSLVHWSRNSAAKHLSTKRFCQSSRTIKLTGNQAKSSRKHEHSRTCACCFSTRTNSSTWSEPTRPRECKRTLPAALLGLFHPRVSISTSQSSRLCPQRGLTLWRRVEFTPVFGLAGEGQTPY